MRISSLHEFLTIALKPEIYQRKGQRFMNMLRIHRPDLEEKLLSTNKKLDVFYDDSRLWATVKWVEENWDSETKDEKC